MSLDGWRRDAGGELVQHGRARQLARLVDALPVGVRKPGGVREPLRDEQAQDDGERGLGCPGALQRVERGGVRLVLGFRAARVADGRPPCLLVVVGCSTQSRCAHAAALPCSSSTSEPSSLTASVSSFGSHRASAAPRSRLRARAAARSSYWRCRSWRRASFSSPVVGSEAWSVWRWLMPARIRGGVGGDLLHESIREPLGIGDVAWVRSLRPGEFEQAAERARGVDVLGGQREALAPAVVLGLPRRPVVLGRVRDLRQRGERGGDALGVAAELGEHDGDRLLVAG